MTLGRVLLWTLILLVGDLPASYAADDVGPAVGKFEVHADSSSPARTISFGQIFLPGTVQRGDHLQVTLDGHAAATQMDPKAFHADGSVRHAIMTVALPALRSGQELDGVIVRQMAGAGAEALPADAPVPPLDVVVSLKDKDGAVHKIDVNLSAVAQDPGNAVPGLWIKGPLAQERRFKADANDHLQILFDVFTPRDGPARVDVIFHNDWTGIRQGDELVYDVDMNLGGAPLYQARNVHHYAFSTWHHLLWTDGGSSLRIVPDLAALEAAAAVPRYAPDFPLTREVAGDIAKAGNGAKDTPLQSGTLDRNMPDAGSRWDIGPLPTWAVIDLLMRSETTRKLLMANADAAGSVPWHLRERRTGLPITIDAHPKAWLDSRGEGTVQEGLLPEVFHEATSSWTLDDAHQPSLTYLPYLLTGSQYYRDELSSQAAYVLLYYDPDYRGGSQGLIMGLNDEGWWQVRGYAWSLRTMANAAYILPAADPLRDYFDAKLKGNLAKLVQIFVRDRKLKAAGPLEGWVDGNYGTAGATAPWQQGYLAVVLSWINDMGYPDAGRMVAWMSPFLTGPFVNRDQGFDPDRGAAYNLRVSNPDNGQLLDSWAASFNQSGLADKSAHEIVDTWQNYGRIAEAALAGVLSIAPTPQVQQAYDFVRARDARISWPYAKGDPTFAILPRGASGAP